jgi:hypothetical protein
VNVLFEWIAAEDPQRGRDQGKYRHAKQDDGCRANELQRDMACDANRDGKYDQRVGRGRGRP